jgi:alkylation response protein AidB-like acyl-CoA dehydrogenase
LELRGQGHLALAAPGRGETIARHRALMEFGRTDLSLARLAEAHADALAIMDESSQEARRNALYGVWASDGPQSRVVATGLADGGWRIDGLKQYCSGATLVDAALVTAHAKRSILLFDVPLDAPGVKVCPSTWATPAFADTATAPVSFDEVRLPARALIGGDDWYLSRAGFWHGAMGPAACWAGGAMALVDAAVKLGKQDSHSRAHVGALLAIAWGIEALLDQAGAEIDADPADRHRRARARALKARHLIERWCTEVLDRFGRASGPQLLAFDDHVARQYAALTLYIRQCHAERDLEQICA